jgi:hypothetical protein
VRRSRRLQVFATGLKLFIASGVQVGMTLCLVPFVGCGQRRKRSSPTVVMAFLCVLSILAGCASRRTVSSTSTSTSFQLRSLKTGPVLFAPTIPESQAINAPVKLMIDRGDSPPSVFDACSIKDDPFGLVLTGDNRSAFQIVLPTPERWLSDSQNGSQANQGDIIETFNSFLADLDRLQLMGCFASTSSPVRDYTLQSIPMRPSDSLFNAYGYLIERGGLDLKTDLRVKIERAYFSATATGEEQHTVKKYLGVSTSNFDVEQTGGGKLRFQQIGDIKYSPETFATGGEEGNRDVGLRELPQRTHYRLLFYTYLVPTEQDISAAIIGADSGAQLDELEREIRVHLTNSCETAELAKEKNETCFAFKGFVTVSVQIKVQLNGKFQFVDWGTKVRSVLPNDTVKSLKIQRQFMGCYYDVRFNPSNSDILSLALVGGDRLTW